MDLKKELFKVGTLVNTFGKNGTLKLMIDTNYSFNSEVDWSNKIFFYKDKDNILQPIIIKKINQTQDNLIMIDFEGFDSINKSEKIKNKQIYSLHKDNLFLEVVDYKQYTMVFNINGEEIKSKIIDLMENSQYNLYKVRLNDQDIWIPDVDEYIVDIDDEQQYIFAKNIERFVK